MIDPKKRRFCGVLYLTAIFCKPCLFSFLRYRAELPRSPDLSHLCCRSAFAAPVDTVFTFTSHTLLPLQLRPISGSRQKKLLSQPFLELSVNNYPLGFRYRLGKFRIQCKQFFHGHSESFAYIPQSVSRLRKHRFDRTFTYPFSFPLYYLG